jgi:hypothetical protein
MSVSRAFIRESEEQAGYLEWQKLLKDREELLRILEKKKNYLLEDPDAAQIPADKRREMIARYEAEAEEVQKLIDEMLADAGTP